MASNDVDPRSFGMDQPHSFRLLFEPDSEQAGIENALSTSRGIDYRWVTDSAGGPALDLTVVNPGTRWGPVFSVLWRLQQGGVVAHDFLPLDVLGDATDEWLDEALTMWTNPANRRTGRRRLESCSGDQIMERFRTWIIDKGNDASFAMSLAAFNTPGPGTFLTLVDEAHHQSSRGRPGRKAAGTLLDHGAIPIARLCSHLGRYRNTDFPEGSLPELIVSEWWDVRWCALRALALSPGTLSSSTVDVLCELIRSGSKQADVAARALAKAEPSQGLCTFLSEVFAVSSGDLRRETASAFCRLWPDKGRPLWTELLTKSHIFDRSLGRHLLVSYGTIDDVPAAAKELRRIIRTKRKRGASPPIGSALVPFLIRHRDHADAQACLDELRSRWGSLEDRLRTWIEERYPELAG